MRSQSLALDTRIIGLVALAHGLSHFFQIVVAVLFPLVRDDLGVSYAALGATIALLDVHVPFGHDFLDLVGVGARRHGNVGLGGGTAATRRLAVVDDRQPVAGERHLALHHLHVPLIGERATREIPRSRAGTVIDVVLDEAGASDLAVDRELEPGFPGARGCRREGEPDEESTDHVHGPTTPQRSMCHRKDCAKIANGLPGDGSIMPLPASESRKKVAARARRPAGHPRCAHGPPRRTALPCRIAGWWGER